MTYKKRKIPQKNNMPAEIIGWAGVASYILAYFFLVIGVFRDDTFLFHAMYLLGAAGIIYHSYIKHDLQPVIVNVFFGTIALLALVKLVGL